MFWLNCSSENNMETINAHYDNLLENPTDLLSEKENIKNRLIGAKTRLTPERYSEVEAKIAEAKQEVKEAEYGLDDFELYTNAVNYLRYVENLLESVDGLIVIRSLTTGKELTVHCSELTFVSHGEIKKEEKNC